VLANDTDDGTDLTVELVTDTNKGTLALFVDGSFTYLPDADYNGSDFFVYKVSDGEYESNEATVTLTINPLNDAPILDTIVNQTIDELDELTFTATASDVDLPSPTLGFSLKDAPSGALIDAGTGVFSWTPTEEQGPNTYTFNVCVSDGVVDVCEEITVTVNEINIDPILDPIGNQSVVVGETLTFIALASDNDLPAQKLSFSLVDAPTDASIDSETGEFSWDTTGILVGDFTFDVCVSDVESTVCETIVVTVTEVPDPMPFKTYLPVIFR